MGCRIDPDPVGIQIIVLTDEASLIRHRPARATIELVIIGHACHSMPCIGWQTTFPRSRAMSLLEICPAKREEQAVIPPEAQGWEKASKQLEQNEGRQQNSMDTYDARQQGHQAEPELWWAENESRQLSPRGMRNNSKQRRACRTMKGMAKR
jgi:hypothetical protein